jgi:predicted cupin superfamily sugar epimerase
MTADEIIALLGLQPHPEGGFYRETFRDPATDASGRSRSTVIYFLLKDGQSSHWHQVDAAETWLWHAGAPLNLHLAPGDAGPVTTLVLGSDLAAGQRPQGLVPPHWWQAARSGGGWTLVSCTVAPGFDFAGFRLAPKGWAPGSGA